jgi:cytidyltransferase-like protein
MKNKKVVIFGVFDGLHAGHLFLIQKAKKAGTNLFVIVAKDKIVQKLKNKIPKYNQNKSIKQHKPR